MLSVKRSIIVLIMMIGLLSGCTQVVTAPIKIVGATVSTTIDVAGSAAHAVVGSDDED